MIKTVQVLHMHNVLVKSGLTRFTPPVFCKENCFLCLIPHKVYDTL